VSTKAEKQRMDAIDWCLPCQINQHQRQPTIQHVTEGGRRLGHMYTYGSCPWHHQSKTENGYDDQGMTGLLGPSFAHSRKTFEDWYGDERDVLVKLQTWVMQNPNHRYWQLIEKWHLLRSAN